MKRDVSAGLTPDRRHGVKHSIWRVAAVIPALLRRWAQERLPAGTQAAVDAGEWIRETLMQAAGPHLPAQPRGPAVSRSPARASARRSQQCDPRAHRRTRAPPPRVEQLIGSNRVGDWEAALAFAHAHAARARDSARRVRARFAAIAAEMELSEPVARAETVNALAALIDALGERRRGARCLGFRSWVARPGAEGLVIHRIPILILTSGLLNSVIPAKAGIHLLLSLNATRKPSHVPVWFRPPSLAGESLSLLAQRK